MRDDSVMALMRKFAYTLASSIAKINSRNPKLTLESVYSCKKSLERVVF
jgi:hypothetical protein